MKAFFLFLISILVLFSCAQKNVVTPEITPIQSKSVGVVSKPTADGVRILVCPAANFLSSGITNTKPTSAEDLVRTSVTPPVGPSKEWNINSLAAGGETLFLSCYYKTKKILTFKLPLEKEYCIAKDTDKKLFVECIKK